jgi:large subunit ribosomal protein L22
MEARAIHRYIGSSPRKMRLVIDMIRGKSVNEALHILHFSPKHASKIAEKVLRSAVSNLQNKDEAGRVEPDEMVVKTAYVDQSISMKRALPAPMGRAFRMRKRSNHVTVVVMTRPEKTAAPKKPAVAASKAKTRKKTQTAEKRSAAKAADATEKK